MYAQSHEQLVADFFRRAERDDPEGYQAVCEKYPVLSRQKIRYQCSREIALPDEWA